MRKAGGQLAETRQAVLEAQLLFERDHLREIGEQADGAAQRALAVLQR